MKAHIVVGLGYGDEGKGITTDFLCSKLDNPIVVRFNGGQQAGHTVIKDGIKHTHSNFGSGSLRDIPTYFSEHTTIYPVTIRIEHNILEEKGFTPNVSFHPFCLVTTPWDVFANELDVKQRSNTTCGLGIGKTMHRNLHSPYKIYAIDLLHPVILFEKLKSLSEYYPEIDTSNEEFIKEMDLFSKAVLSYHWFIYDYDVLKAFNNIIFEGAQGVLLDMDHGIFPYVTYSNTTSKNAHMICDSLGIEHREKYLVTRAYHTRHGEGPFTSHELTLVNNEEEINVFNEYQKTFKVGKLDYSLLNHAINIEKYYKGMFPFNLRTSLVITCNDQIEEQVNLERIKHPFDNYYFSNSPESKNFKTQKYERI